MQTRKIFLGLSLSILCAACAVSVEPELTGEIAQGLGGSGGGAPAVCCYAAEPVCPRKSFSDCGPGANDPRLFLAACCASDGTISESMQQCALNIDGTTFWLSNLCPSCPVGSGMCAISAAGAVMCGPLFGAP